MKKALFTLLMCLPMLSVYALDVTNLRTEDYRNPI